MPKTMEDRYLGDGVYASFDGFHIWLDLRAQDSTTRIALEPEILRALNQYKTDIVKFYEKVLKDEPEGPGEEGI